MKSNACAPLVRIIAPFIRALMQVVSAHLSDFNMVRNPSSYSTKCLNTSVLLWFLFLGKRHVDRDAKRCDVDRIMDRGDASLHVLDALDLDVLSSRRRGSASTTLWFVLLTEATLHTPANESVYFPGHVFILERYADRYWIYQSYVDHYDLAHHVIRWKSSTGSREAFRASKPNVIRILKLLRRVFTPDTLWDAECTREWQWFTGIDLSNLEGGASGRDIRLCVAKRSSKTCARRMRRFIDREVRRLSQLPDVFLDTPCCASTTNTPSTIDVLSTSSFLTHRQVSHQLRKLTRRLDVVAPTAHERA